ncbi:MAG: transporter [Pirellulaceae bacterium]|nr:MAG: transporter [Pirellulaceae bacterium]
MLQRTLVFWLLAVCGMALYWEPLGAASAVGDPWLWLYGHINAMIVATMFSVGVLLPREELVALGRMGGPVAGGVLCQYAAMPALAWLATRIFPLSPEDQLGVVMVGCVPGAMASNVLTLNARGHVGYSVSLTTLATLVSPAAVPAAMLVALGTWHYDPLLLRSALFMVVTVVVPVLAGHCAGRLVRATFARGLAALVANLLVLLIIASVVAKTRHQFTRLHLVLPAALLAINLAGYGAGWTAATMLKLPSPMRRALTLEIGMQNAGLGAALAVHLFPTKPEVAVAPALYSFGCMLTGTLLSQYWALRPPASA